MIMTTAQLFRFFRLPKSECARNISTAYSKVPLLYKVMFKKYTVTEWPRFNERASTMLVGENEQTIPADDLALIQAIPDYWRKDPKPESEGGLLHGFQNNVTRTVNYLRRGSATWKSYFNATASSVDGRGHRRKPDFALITDSGSTNEQGRREKAIVVGEMKSPTTTYLGSGLSATHVNNIIHHKDYHKCSKAKAFFQVFSYMLRTTKGVGVLTTYDHIRFFKINAKEKTIYMSPLVRVDQLLSNSEGTPHTIQAFFYTDSLEDQLEDRRVQKVLEVQLEEARKNAESEQRRIWEEDAAKEAARSGAGASSSSDHKKSKKPSKSGGKHGKQKKWSSDSIVSPVTLVLDKCKLIGALGEGLCGPVDEFDYEGMKVALKVGLPCDPVHDEEDCFAAVKNEIEVYERLQDLQGEVIPRMVIGGFERLYNPDAMVIITEKVGMAIRKSDDGLFVGEKKLTRDEVLAIKEKGLEGLKKIHEHGVVHCDAAVRNIRVDMKDGKMDVWWLDFGHAENMHYESESEGDNETYEADVDELLKMMNSQR